MRCELPVKYSSHLSKPKQKKCRPCSLHEGDEQTSQLGRPMHRWDDNFKWVISTAGHLGHGDSQIQYVNNTELRSWEVL